MFVAETNKSVWVEKQRDISVCGRITHPSAISSRSFIRRPPKPTASRHHRQEIPCKHFLLEYPFEMSALMIDSRQSFEALVSPLTL
jgi:hypothetical protein